MTRRSHKFRGLGAAIGAIAVVGALLLAAPALSAPSLVAWWGDAGEGDGQIGADAPGIAVDAQGDVYVVDRAVERVKRFTNAGAPVTAWGGMARPSAVAVAPDGSIYAGDAEYLRRFTRDGAPVAGWPGEPRFEAPAAQPLPGEATATTHPRGVGGIAVAADGTVYATDLGANRIRRFDDRGAELPSWGGVREPRGVAVAPSGDVYVADDGNNRVRRLSPQGAELGSWALEDPHGMAVAPDGQVYVTEPGSHRVLRYDAEGKLQEAFGDTGEGGARLTRPEAVAVDCQGTAYVVDGSEKRVHVFGDAAAAPPPCPPDPIDPDQVDPTPTPTPTPTTTPTPTPTPTATPTPEPQLGATTLAEVVAGKVLVDTGKGKPEPLAGPAIVPIGATVDATQGRARLTFETAPDARPQYGPYQSGEFYGGEFTVHQARDGTLVELRLAGAMAARKHHRGAQASKKKKRRRKRGVRRLWGNAEGRFRTTGRYAAATVRGTRWLTEDRADGTLVRVQEGVVAVDALERGRHVTLRAGQDHLARRRCASRRNFRIRLRAPVGAKIRKARVLVNGKRTRVWRGRRTKARVDLRGLPKGRVTVRIAIRTSTGLTLRGTRSYHTCTKARRDGRVPRP